MKTKGFTLVELLVVIAILAILATVSVVGYTSFIDNANKSAAETEIHQVETSVNAFLMAGDSVELGKKADNTVVYVGFINNAVTAYTVSGTTKTPIDADTEITLTGDFAGVLNAEGTTLKINGAVLTYTYATGKTVSATFKK